MTAPKPIDRSRIDPNPVGIQPRAELDAAAVQRYRESYQEGTALPPITVWNIKGEPLLRISDGYHRFAAQSGSSMVKARIMEGTMLECMAAAIKSNSAHGVALSDEDRFTSVKRYIEKIMGEGKDIPSTRVLAEQCGVSKSFVAKAMQEARSPVIKSVTTSADSFDDGYEGDYPSGHKNSDSEPESGFKVSTVDSPDKKVRNELPAFGKSKPHPVNESTVDTQINDIQILQSEAMTLLNQLNAKLTALSEMPMGYAVKRYEGRNKQTITDIRSTLSGGAIVTKCLHCDGKMDPETNEFGCRWCYNTGAMSRDQKSQYDRQHN